MDGWPDKAIDKRYVRIERLEEMGHELRRPEADTLRDGIYELRIRHLRVHYRILYFFHDGCAILFDGLTKEDVVPPSDIDRAIEGNRKFANDPKKHTYEVDKHED